MARVSVVVVLVAALLVPALAAPARTIEVPRTLARTTLLAPNDGRVRLSMAATHVAFSWEGERGTAVRYRTVTPGAGTSEWQLATEDESIDGTRYSAIMAVDHPTTVVYEPVTPRGKTMGAITFDYLNTEDGPVETRRIPATADAAANTPNVVTRAEWGADESIKKTSGSCKRDFHPVQQLFVHHTAGQNNDSNPPSTMRAIYWYHTVRLGWCDLGYNFVIGWDGKLYEGRWARGYTPWETHDSENGKGEAVVGAHVAGYNSGSVGVSLMGNFETAKLPRRMRRTLVNFLAWEADRHDLDPTGSHIYRNPDSGTTRSLKFIAGHRDAGQTACPGRHVYKQLDAIRSDVAARIGAGKQNTRTTLTAPATAPQGSEVTLTGALTGDGGAGLVGRTIDIYRRRGEWRKITSVVTDATGAYSHRMIANSKLVLRSAFEDDGTAWESQSPKRVVKMAPAPSPTETPSPAPPRAGRLQSNPQAASADPGDEIPITVTADDGSGNPAPGVEIEWNLSSHGFFVTQPETTTGADGQATATVTMTERGRLPLTISSADCDGDAGPGPCSFEVDLEFGVPRACDEVGTPGADSLKGNGSDQVLCGFSGGDVLYGWRGRDELRGHSGHDVLRAGRGHDVLRGNKGRDALVGGRGRDLCKGGRGRDSFKSCDAR